MKKKRKNKIFLISIIVLIIAIAGFSIFYKTILATKATSDYWLRPTFGYLSCSPIDCNQITKTMSGVYGQTNMNNPNVATMYNCQMFMGINDGCQITLQTIDGNIDKLTDTTQQLDYQLVPDGTPFIENEAITIDGGSLGYDNDERAILNLKRDDILWVRFTEGKGALDFTHHKVNGKVNFVVSGTCFTIRDNNDWSSTNGQIIQGAVTGDCVLRSNDYKDRMIDSFSSVMSPLVDRQLDYDELNYVNLNAPYRTYTYLRGLEPASYTYGSVQTYNGQNVWCDKGTLNLYSIGQITSNGITYNSVIYDESGKVGSVNICCEGDKLPSKVCQNDQWVDSGSSYCNLDEGVFCSEPDWQPYSNDKCRKFACVNNQCEVQYLPVECTNNQACGTGYVCKREGECGGICVEQGFGDICGDKICSVFEFNNQNCKIDCGENGGGEGGLIGIIIIILALIFVALLITLITRNKNQGGDTF